MAVNKVTIIVSVLAVIFSTCEAQVPFLGGCPDHSVVEKFDVPQVRYFSFF